MRRLASVVFSTLLVNTVVTRAQEASLDRNNVECGVRIRLPSYPTIARAARIAGKVTAVVSLADDGRPAGIEVAGAHPLLRTAVEKELRSSEFSSTCGGRQVRLVFEFLIVGEPVEHPQSTFVFMPPNRFAVSTRPGIPMP